MNAYLAASQLHPGSRCYSKTSSITDGFVVVFFVLCFCCFYFYYYLFIYLLLLLLLFLLFFLFYFYFILLFFIYFFIIIIIFFFLFFFFVLVCSTLHECYISHNVGKRTFVYVHQRRFGSDCAFTQSIGILTGRILEQYADAFLENQGCKISSRGQRRLGTDSMDAPA